MNKHGRIVSWGVVVALAVGLGFSIARLQGEPRTSRATPDAVDRRTSQAAQPPPVREVGADDLQESAPSKEADHVPPARPERESALEAVSWFQLRVVDVISGHPIDQAVVHCPIGCPQAEVVNSDPNGEARVPRARALTEAVEMKIEAKGYYDSVVRMDAAQSACEVRMSPQCSLTWCIDIHDRPDAVLGENCGIFLQVTRDDSAEDSIAQRRMLESPDGIAALFKAKFEALRGGRATILVPNYDIVAAPTSKILCVNPTRGSHFTVAELKFGDVCELCVADNNAEPILRRCKITSAAQDLGAIHVPQHRWLDVFLQDELGNPVSTVPPIRVKCANTRMLDAGDGSPLLLREKEAAFVDYLGKSCAFFKCTVGDEYLVSVVGQPSRGARRVRVSPSKGGDAPDYVAVEITVLGASTRLRRIEVVDAEQRRVANAVLRLGSAGDAEEVWTLEPGVLEFCAVAPETPAEIDCLGYESISTSVGQLPPTVKLTRVAQHAVKGIRRETGGPLTGTAQLWRADASGVHIQPLSIDAGQCLVDDPGVDARALYLVAEGCAPAAIYYKDGRRWFDSEVTLRKSAPSHVAIIGRDARESALAGRELMKSITITQFLGDEADLSVPCSVELNSSLQGSILLWRPENKVRLEWPRYGAKTPLPLGEVAPQCGTEVEIRVAFPF